MITKLLKFLEYNESLQLDIAKGTIDINESLNILQQSILTVIGAQEVDMDTIFKIKIDRKSLDNFIKNTDIQKALRNIDLKYSELYNTNDFQTFIAVPTKFLFIYNINSSELDNPEYILIQGYNKSISKWEKFTMFSVNGDIKRFYDKLSAKTIEITHDGNKYIYNSNNGNEWNLISSKETDLFKKYYRKEDFMDFINDNKFQIQIV